jgi:hypothetical protein
LTSFLIASGERAYRPYLSGVAMSLGLAAASLSFLLFRGDPSDALLGAALGFAVVAGVFRAACRVGSEPDLPRALEGGAALAATLGAACGLAIYHFGQPSQRGWWAFPLALAAFWLLGLLVSFAATTQKALARYPVLLLAISAAVSTVLALVFGHLLARRLEPAQALLWVLVSGAAVAVLLLWLARTVEREDDAWPLRLQTGALAAVLVVFLVALSYKLLAGFGVAVALLAAWAALASGFGIGGLTGRLCTGALLVGGNYLLLRLFLERSGTGLGDVELSFHYTLIGVTLGALLPWVYSSLMLAPGLLRALLLGALAAISPVVVLVLWGPDAILGLLVGLVAAQGMALVLVGLAGADQRLDLWQAAGGLLGLGMALVAVQFSRSLAFAYQMPRANKRFLAAGIAVLLLLWAVTVWLVQALRQRRTAVAAGPGPGG